MVLTRKTTMTRSTLPALLVLAMLAAAPCDAQAGPPIVTESGAGDQEADALFRQGNAAVDAGKVEQAYKLLLGAWKLKQTHDIAGNLAQVELKLGKTRDAAEHIAFALAHFPPSVTMQSDRIEKMKRVLDGLRKDLGTLRIRVNVEGARVFVDGKPIGESPLADVVFVDPGSHVVQARAAGYLDREARIDAAKGSAPEVALQLVAVPEAPPVPPVPPAPQRRSLVPGVVLGSVAGAALVTGIVVVAVGANKHASNVRLNQEILQAHHSCVPGAANFDPQCATLESSSSAAGALGRAGMGVLIGAGAAAVGSALYFLWPESKPQAPASREIRVVPVGSTSSGGLSVSGTF
jgi:hypothetical protein